MADIDEREERYSDRFLNASFSFWNSLIILNSLLIGATSILFSINAKICVFFILSLFFLCILSIILLVWNYLVVKGIYYKILNAEDYFKNTPTDQLNNEFNKDIKKTLKQRRWLILREKYSLFLTSLSVIYIFILLIIFS